MPETISKNRSAVSDRIVRYEDLRPCYDAFIDTRTPGSDQKENFTIIGPGVSENPNQHVHIAEPHGFNIGGARQPPGCTNSQHSHDTAEVFYVHSGTWRFDLGEHGDDAQTYLQPGDLISIPTKLFRGFTNVGEDTGFLWAVLGGDDPGRVLWAPKVFELAEEFGLVLLDDGMLVDTAAGQHIPAGKSIMPKTTVGQVKALQRFSNEELETCVARSNHGGPRGPMDGIPGVRDTQLVGRGRMDWNHGFTVSEMTLDPGAAIPRHKLECTDVHFVQSGKAVCTIGDDTTIVSSGDTITFAAGEGRSIRNASDQPVTIVAVRGGDAPVETHWS